MLNFSAYSIIEYARNKISWYEKNRCSCPENRITVVAESEDFIYPEAGRISKTRMIPKLLRSVVAIEDVLRELSNKNYEELKQL